MPSAVFQYIDHLLNAAEDSPQKYSQVGAANTVIVYRAHALVPGYGRQVWVSIKAVQSKINLTSQGYSSQALAPRADLRNARRRGDRATCRDSGWNVPLLLLFAQAADTRGRAAGLDKTAYCHELGALYSAHLRLITLPHVTGTLVESPASLRVGACARGKRR